ncbi:MAG: CBS domain-containing protein [Terriglobales bacterium]
MNRRDALLDGMLRHLGAAYYESLHGRASASDVARALDSVEEHVGQQAGQGSASAGTSVGCARDGGGQGHGELHRGRWHSRVRDVMTTSVVTVDRPTPYKQIASLLAEHKVSAVPVLMMGRRVAGVVSEADLLRVEDKRERSARARRRGLLRWRARRQHWGLTAGELMTSPAITIHPDATISAAARVMNSRHIKRLPVVDPAGALIGIFSRRDLLSVFLRPDEQIARDVRGVFTEILFTDPASVNVVVKGGIVTLTGQPAPLEQPDLIPVAVRLTWDIDGVVDVVNKLTAPQSG